MAETSLEKVLRLATVSVRQYDRFERGKEQVVRPHTEARADAMNPTGWIPEASWKAGQQEWIKEGEAAYEQRGEAAWRRAGREATQRAATADADKDRAASPGDAAADEARSTGEAPLRQAPLERQGRSMQSFVQDMEADRQDAARRLSNHPLFAQTVNQGMVAHEQAMAEAADNAVAQAAAASGIYTDGQIAALRDELARLEARLSDMHAQDLAAGKQEVKNQINAEMLEQGRAGMILNILGIVASLIVAAFAGGIGSLIAELMAAKWTIDIAQELINYYAIVKGHGTRHIAHPARTAHKAVTKVVQKTKHTPSS